jgi:hypothetical protein
MNSAARDFITVVSGLPRSGTSLMMQMLQAGGVPALTDAVRSADPDNPRGYYELEAVKQLKTSKDWLSRAVGKSVKIVHMLLLELPVTHNYRVVFMHRDLAEVVRSQAVMLERSGRPAASMTAQRLSHVYAGQIAMVRKWLDERKEFRVLGMQYADIVTAPAAKAAEVNSFLGGTLDVNAMAAAVDPSLYRNRGS